MRMHSDKLEFVVKWKPFELNPSFPESQLVDKRDYYVQRFGGAQRVEGMIARLGGVFASEGIDFKFEGPISNSFNAHRVLLAAEQQGSQEQDAAMEVLFNAYFCDSKSPNDEDVLKQACRAANVPEEVATNKMKFAEEVRMDQRRYKGRVQGVPYFIIDGKYKLEGAQPPDIFDELFEEIESK